nr:hypothetical protein [Tanacetum cinerariifolium]
MQQAEIAELRETDRRRQAQMSRRARQPGEDAKVPDHQDAPRDAMINQAILQNSTNGDGSHNSHEDNRRNVQTARPCFYADLMKCQPLNFKDSEGMVGLTRHIRSLGPDAYSMTWEVLKKKITDKYYPQGEIKKLEIELWNLKASKPKTLDETIELANDLMDQKL